MAAGRNPIGTISLVAAVVGAAGTRAASTLGPFAGAPWLEALAGGFEAAVVGGLADWFAVTALFRHPMGIPIPHTAIIPARRAKIIEGIVTMVERDWLSPEVIGARLGRLAPSTLIADWLRDPEHVARLGGPLRDLLRGVARTLDAPELAELVERTIERQLREVPLDATSGQALVRFADSDSAATAFATIANSLANLARRPRTATELHWWLDRSAELLRDGGKRVVPFVLRRQVVQRALVEAVCDYAAAELHSAAADAAHPLRRLVLGSVKTFGDRLAAGDADALARANQVRTALVESLEAGPLVRNALSHLRAQIETDLADPQGTLSQLVDRKLRDGILELLDDPARRDAFDRWVRATADDLLRRHHHEIGRTVRENLEALETGALVAQIENRVGSDLQFIRLNGALVGGLVGLLLTVARLALH